MTENPIADFLAAMFKTEATNEQILAAVRSLETALTATPARPRQSSGNRRREWDRARKAKLPNDWTAITRAVFERDAFSCTYCGDEPYDLHCDHIVPLSRGGSSDMDNLTTACAPCNLDKGSRLLSEWPFYQEYILGVMGLGGVQ